jgi:hypothetical protein
MNELLQTLAIELSANAVFEYILALWNGSPILIRNTANFAKHISASPNVSFAHPW